MAKKIQRVEYKNLPDLQECKMILLLVIQQAVKDYEHFRNKTKEEDVFIWETARDFLFDDEYYIEWGNLELNLQQLCAVLEIEIEWLRNKVVSKLDIQFLKDGRVLPDRTY